MTRPLTADEQSAIRSLERLARRWPQSLRLFSWSGTLVIMDAGMPNGEDAFLATIQGIPNDGGDP
jgi:hypothetical protein